MTSYAQALTPLIRTILSSSDLSTISAKRVRKDLISRGQDEATIKANRSDIDEIISGLYDEMTAQAPSTPSPPAETKPRVNATPSGSGSGSGSHPPSSVPRPLQKPKVKRETQSKAEISGSEDEGQGQGDMDDEAYARQLQSEFNSLQAARPSRAGSRPKLKKKVVKRKARSEATVDGDGSGEDGPKKKRAAPNTAFNKDMILSDALSTLVGETRLSRPQTVKRIWDYVKERGLQDPSDKRYIVCEGDEKLKAVFHTDRLHMFTMNKILSKHFMDPEDVVVKKDEPEVL